VEDLDLKATTAYFLAIGSFILIGGVLSKQKLFIFIHFLTNNTTIPNEVENTSHHIQSMKELSSVLRRIPRNTKVRVSIWFEFEWFIITFNLNCKKLREEKTYLHTKHRFSWLSNNACSTDKKVQSRVCTVFNSTFFLFSCFLNFAAVTAVSHHIRLYSMKKLY
jgi:hypothetical protein